MSSNAKHVITSTSKSGETTQLSGNKPSSVTSGGQAVSTLPFTVDPVLEPPKVTGSKGGNAALTSVIAALVQLGFIDDLSS